MFYDYPSCLLWLSVFPCLPVHVPVQTVIVGDQLILSLVVALGLQVHVLQVGKVRLVPRQGDGGHIHHVFACIVVKNLQYSNIYNTL